MEHELNRKERQIVMLSRQEELNELQARWGVQRRRGESTEILASPFLRPQEDGIPDSKVFEYFEHQEWEKRLFREDRWLQPKRGTPEATWQEMDPPDGHQWDGEWKVDVGHTSVDQEGWSYGTTKDELSERRDSGVSNTHKGDDDQLRARKWIRRYSPMLGDDECFSDFSLGQSL